MNDYLIFKNIGESFTDYQNSIHTLSQKCHCYIDEVMESRSYIRFNSENREIGFPEIVSGDTTMKICGLSKNFGVIHLISALTNEVTYIKLDAVDVFNLYAICCEIKEVLENEYTNYLLNHNKEYLKDIKENDPKFVQDIVEAYKHYEIMISKMRAKDILSEFVFENEKDSTYVEEGREKGSLFDVILPFVKIVDYYSQYGNDVILKIENGVVIAQ